MLLTRPHVSNSTARVMLLYSGRDKIEVSFLALSLISDPGKRRGERRRGRESGSKRGRARERVRKGDGERG